MDFWSWATCGVTKSCCCKQEECTQHALAIRNMHHTLTQPCVVDSGEIQFEFVRTMAPPVQEPKAVIQRRFNQAAFREEDEHGDQSEYPDGESDGFAAPSEGDERWRTEGDQGQQTTIRQGASPS
mmetsp:Transcript_39817/g.91100  ORF Transcript_39817/g.91100 Transcript_39817/m.91100 type:complete len:125 (-) Transcript_39817:65-439(-)